MSEKGEPIYKCFHCECTK